MKITTPSHSPLVSRPHHRLAVLLSLALILGSTAVFSRPAQGAAIVGNTADNELHADGNVGTDTGVAIRVGSSSAGRNAIFIFQLPDLGLVANPFAAATLTLTFVTRTNTTAYNVDLWGLDGSTSASTTIPAGSYFGSASTDPNNFLIQDDFLLSNSTVGSYTTSAGGSANLLSFLNSEYAGGDNIGKYVFIRANLDVTPSGTNGFNLGSANNTTPANQPFITYTAVPEPSSALLLALGAVAICVVRRKKAHGRVISNT